MGLIPADTSPWLSLPSDNWGKGLNAEMDHQWRQLAVCCSCSRVSKSETTEAPVGAVKPARMCTEMGSKTEPGTRRPLLESNSGSENDLKKGVQIMTPSLVKVAPLLDIKWTETGVHKNTTKFNFGAPWFSAWVTENKWCQGEGIVMISGAQNDAISNKPWPANTLSQDLPNQKCTRNLTKGGWITYDIHSTTWNLKCSKYVDDDDDDDDDDDMMMMMLMMMIMTMMIMIMMMMVVMVMVGRHHSRQPTYCHACAWLQKVRNLKCPFDVDDDDDDDDDDDADDMMMTMLMMMGIRCW